MTQKVFSPDYHALGLVGGYVPLYKFFEGDDWHKLMRNGKHDMHQTYSQARQAAKEFVAQKATGKVIVAEIHAETDPEMAKFYDGKAKQYAESAIIKRKRSVIVQKKGERKARKIGI